MCSRSARLTAAAIAGVLKRLGHVAGTGGSGTSIAPPPRVVIAFDGSVFSKYNKYRCGRCGHETLRQQGGVVVTRVVAPAGTWLSHPHQPLHKTERLNRLPPPVPRERLRSALEEVCGKEAADSIHLQLAQDGSLLGAAFLAVAAAEWEAASSGSSGAAA